MSEHILVVGATGLVGAAAMRHFAGRGDCKVTALSRRRPSDTFGARALCVDLADARSCRECVLGLDDVTRVVYAALYEKPGLIAGWLDAEQIDRNRRMLENLLDPLISEASGLRHISLLQGTKAYGVHVAPISAPARENRSERRDVPNFYWAQEDYLRSKQPEAGWSWSILRPQVIFGSSIGAAMNLIPAIGVFAALRKQRGEPLAYPGGIGPVMEAVDADLLAHAIDWAGTSPAARNEVFNVTNGDVFVWQNVWPCIADALGMEPGPNEPERLGESMPNRSREWDEIRARHGLISPGMQEFVGESFHYADFCMAYGSDAQLPPALVSTVKLRQAGFGEVMDTELMFQKWFRHLQESKLLPPR